MRYIVDIENDDSLTLSDAAGLLEVVISGPSLLRGPVSFDLNELQLEELLRAIRLIQEGRGIKHQIPVYTYPPGVRGGTFTTNASTVQDSK